MNTDYCDLLSPEQLREHEDDWFHPRDDVMKECKDNSFDWFNSKGTSRLERLISHDKADIIDTESDIPEEKASSLSMTHDKYSSISSHSSQSDMLALARHLSKPKSALQPFSGVQTTIPHACQMAQCGIQGQGRRRSSDIQATSEVRQDGSEKGNRPLVWT